MIPPLSKDALDIVSIILTHPRESRPDLVLQLCAGRDDVKRQVEELLAYEEQTGGFLERDSLPPDSARIGTRAGAWELESVIGAGGMGVVYRARRADGQYEMTAAVKLVSQSMGVPGFLQRFLSERQIMAALSHPNIARLLDGGVTGDGIPYLAMEYIEGLPIHEHCRANKLSLVERAGLFRQLCDGVHYAHQHLVIHRDIKPANVLVDSSGKPKLLDFGVAKVLESGGRSTAPTALHAMTLNYASPEQVAGKPLTTASDVYSLGLLLHELLADRRAIDVSGLAPGEAVRVISETPPVISASLPPDLQAVIEKALAKDASLRYSGPRELSDDLQRYLDGLPVSARPPSFTYLFSRFVARHRIPVAAIAAGFLLAFSGAGAALWQWKKAEANRGVAQRRFDELRGLARSVLFEFQNGLRNLAGSLEVRKTMARRSVEYLDSLSREVAGDPGLAIESAKGYHRLGQIQGDLGERSESEESFAKSRLLLEGVLSSDAANGEARWELSEVLTTHALRFNTREGALSLLTAAQQHWTQLDGKGTLPAHRIKHGRVRTQFAYSLRQLGAARIEEFQKTLEQYRSLLASAPNDTEMIRNVALCHKYLAGAYGKSYPERSEFHTREALALDRRRAAASPGDAIALRDLAIDLVQAAEHAGRRGAVREEEAFFDEALSLRRAFHEKEPKSLDARRDLVSVLMRQGIFFKRTGRMGEARKTWLEALRHGESIGAEIKNKSDLHNRAVIRAGLASLPKNAP